MSLTTPNKEIIASIEEKFNNMEHMVGIEFSNEELSVLRDMFNAKGGNHPEIATPVRDQGQGKKEALVDVTSKFKNFCYLALVRVLPGFESSEYERFQDAFLAFKHGLGEEPSGDDVLVNLCVLERVLQGELDISLLSSDELSLTQGVKAYSESEVHLKTLAKMLESEYRFQFEDKSGRLHVTYMAKCHCKEILCDHGWSPRFILQIITREGQTVGAAHINMSELFISSSEADRVDNSQQHTPLSAFVDKTRDYPAQPKHNVAMNTFMQSEKELEGSYRKGVPVEPLSVKRRQSQSSRSETPRASDMRKQVSDDLVSMLGDQLNSRTEALENALAALLEERNMKVGSTPRSEVVTEESESDVESTILPSDSSTQLNRYKKSFMREGPVYNVRKSSTVLEPVNEISALTTTPKIDVVRGFQMTESMARMDRESVDKVYTINGLACPFKNPRLNFLVHFHTALGSCGIDSKHDPIDALDHIGTMKPQNPTEELIKQCIVRTFDFDEMCVISNPFRLPFIEIGMLVSESMLSKCLSILRSEYRALWFQEMKCLKVPSFHDEFSEFSTHTMVRNYRRDKNLERRHAIRRSSNQTSGESESDIKSGVKKQAAKPKVTRTLLGMSY